MCENPLQIDHITMISKPRLALIPPVTSFGMAIKGLYEGIQAGIFACFFGKTVKSEQQRVNSAEQAIQKRSDKSGSWSAYSMMQWKMEVEMTKTNERVNVSWR